VIAGSAEGLRVVAGAAAPVAALSFQGFNAKGGHRMKKPTKRKKVPGWDYVKTRTVPREIPPGKGAGP
jgi:hypothetical protein